MMPVVATSLLDQCPLDPFGISFSGPLSDCVEVLADALGVHGVVVLREQFLTQCAFRGLLSSLGPLMFTSGETPSPECPDLNIITNRGRSRAPVSRWHTDTSYVDRPPAYTALMPLELPKSGGATCFLNQYVSFDRLSPDLKQALKGRRVRHVLTGVTPEQGTQIEAWQPLFRNHPVSGKAALYLSTVERCAEIEDMNKVETTAVIERLYAHSQTCQQAYAHVWQPGDVVIWDNRCTLHKADHSGVVGARTFVRGMVEGEAPLLA